MSRFPLVALMAAAACAVLAQPAAAYPPNARTDNPTEVTDSGATLNGLAFAGDGQGQVTYHFEYGATTAYGQQTPEATAPAFTPPTPPTVSARVALPGGSTFHFRIVATNAAGEKGAGTDVQWKTPGAPPAGPGTTRTAETVPPGGSISTGSDATKANPIVVTVTSPSGGKITVDEIANPDRPGTDPNAEVNPEDTGPKDKNWYGPAFEIFPPTPAASSDPNADPDAVAHSVTKVVFRIDGDTDLVDPLEWKLLLRDYANPTAQGCGGAPYDNGTRRVLADGDTQITLEIDCRVTLHFYNPGWGVRGGENFGSYYEDLRGVLRQKSISFAFHCTLQCARTITGTIARKSANALGLKSTVIGTFHSDRGDLYGGEFPLSAKVRRALGKITRRGGQITVSFKARAVGPAGQVFKHGMSLKLKAEATQDSF